MTGKTGRPRLCDTWEGETQEEVREVRTPTLKEVYHDVVVQFMLLPLQGEQFSRRSGNLSNDAREDVEARRFWTRGQRL